jgi:hypothetical protein
MSRKRRQKGHLVVSDETVIYGYESSVTLTIDRLNYRPVLSSEWAPQDEEQSNYPAKEGKKKDLVMDPDPRGVPDTKTDRPTDRRS